MFGGGLRFRNRPSRAKMIINRMTFECPCIDSLKAAAEREKDNSIDNSRRFRFTELRQRSYIASQPRFKLSSKSTQYRLYRSEIPLPAGPSEPHEFMRSQSWGSALSREGRPFHMDHAVWKATCSPVPSETALDLYSTSRGDDSSGIWKSDG